uniref:DUF4371 domain-containing protein n=1 Tax=Trichuris muris TaxID=70415 RepID=A0A5S6QJE1_TRIMR
MAEDVEDTLCSLLRNREFSLVLDESTLPGNEAILLAYVRFIKDEHLMQELLFAKELKIDAKGHSIFRIVDEYFKEKKIPTKNILAVATDGASSMVGCHRGFVAYLKEMVPEVLEIHCVVHRQHLVAKYLSRRLNESLQCVITAFSRIKSNSLKDGLFQRFCEENDEEFNRLLLHTEVRWLSKNMTLRDELKSPEADIAYLADLYFKFNEMNVQLQVSDLNLVKTKSRISAFVSKLVLYKWNLSHSEFCQFPDLAAATKNAIPHDAGSDIQLYCDHLQTLHDDFKRRFHDVLSMEVPNWVFDHFTNPVDAEVYLQEELINLQSNEELKLRLKHGYDQFWLQKQIPISYPGQWSVVKKLLISLPSSSLVERCFSVVTDLLAKKRKRLQKVNRGDLRLRLSSIEPEAEKLVRSHLLQCSS